MAKDKVDWEQHQQLFNKAGVSLKDYAEQNGLSYSTARKRLRVDRSEGATTIQEVISGLHSSIAAALAFNEADTIGERELITLRDLLHDYITEQQDNIDYLKRKCESFKGNIHPDHPDYVEPDCDDKGVEKSPLEALATARSKLVGITSNTLKAISNARGGISRSLSTKAAAVVAYQKAVAAEAREQRAQLAVVEALAAFSRDDKPITARQAAIMIGAAGGEVPHVIRAQLTVDLQIANDDEEGEEISQEELDREVAEYAATGAGNADWLENWKRERQQMVLEAELAAGDAEYDSDEADQLNADLPDDEVDWELFDRLNRAKPDDGEDD